MTNNYAAMSNPMSFTTRIAICSGTLALLTLVLILFAPTPAGITLIAQSPGGEGVARNTLISMTFSRPPDKRSAERVFALHPSVAGRFVWRDDVTLVFEPTEPLKEKTMYRVFIRGGLRDTRGRIDYNSYVQWPFWTR